MAMIPIPSLKPKNQRWEYSSIRPGPVGTVGVANVQVRLKHSTPNMAIRWSKDFSKAKLPRIGSNVTDGFHKNYDTGGGPAKVLDSNWGGRRDFSTSHGYIYQDLRPTDRSANMRVEATPQYQWKTNVARVYKVKHGGDKFLPNPGGYGLNPGDISRGGAFPFVREIAGGDEMPNDIEFGNGQMPQQPPPNHPPRRMR